jgi:hypothetical protein
MFSLQFPGSVTATHYVQSVRLGGLAKASIKYSNNITSANMDIKGQFKADLVIGPVNVSAQAEMEILTKEDSTDYSTEISVQARPRLLKAPVNVTEMFAQIDEIDEMVNAEKHYTILSQDITGVPLSFKLVPLAQLIDFKAEAFYKLLADDVMDSFQSMVFTLQDFQTPNYMKRLLI